MWGFRPIILENSILRYDLKGKARSRAEICRVVFGSMRTMLPL